MRTYLPLVLASLSLAACADSPPPQRQTSAVTPFTQALSSEYTQLSRSEQMQADWSDGDTFQQKAALAAAGNPPSPEDPTKRAVGTGWQLNTNVDIGKEQRAEAIQGRQRLTAVLPDGAQRNPQTAARAQATYDCWVEQLEEGWQREDIERCRTAFNAAMAQLETRPVAQANQVFFPLDSAQLTASGQDTVAQIASLAQQQKPARIAVVGHADTSGGDQYNRTLSEARAEAVRNQLVAQGIPADRIVTEARGETDPLVPTPDNVAQAENRRTVIEFD